MTWSTIENLKRSYHRGRVPDHGVAVGTRACGRNGRVYYICLQIGRDLARAARFAQDEQGVRLMLGGGSDAGKIAIVIDQTAGNFVARKQKNGSYKITIGAPAAAGHFATKFESFSHQRIEAVRPENGQPPMFTFKASDAMLNADAD